jgi:transposase InsO family protein
VVQLHKRPPRPEKVPFPITASAPNASWQCDLLDFPDYVRANGGVRYVFTCVDVFTRRCVGLEPLKSKEEGDILRVLKAIIRREEAAPDVLTSDNEGGLLARGVQSFLKQAGIAHQTSFAGDHRVQGIAEGFNHTVRRKI